MEHFRLYLGMSVVTVMTIGGWLMLYKYCTSAMHLLRTLVLSHCISLGVMGIVACCAGPTFASRLLNVHLGVGNEHVLGAALTSFLWIAWAIGVWMIVRLKQPM